ncbi:hypothetical protein EBZ80_01935 [bacterium]|nr:hypothetical protein [bacterium]
MEKIPIGEFLKTHQIEEKIPYFGRARLLQIPLRANETGKRFSVPREVFHFLTSLFLLDTADSGHRYVLRIGPFEKEIHASGFSDLGEDGIKKNVLEDPVFLGMNTPVSLEVLRTDPQKEEMINVLAEFAKIHPDDYRRLHEQPIVLVGREIVSVRGVANRHA